MHTQDWTAGYVSDLAYTFGYFPELNPLRARFALLNKGFAAPRFETGCELGFGQGLSVNIHAAASTTEWYGTDFNPAQAAFARELSEVSGASARLWDEAFEDFCQRTDLPDFDYIGLHGIWSWISHANRSAIVDFLRRKLRPGGVVYVSYNTQPGWAAFAPLRHLMSEHADVLGARGAGTAQRIEGALDFAERLIAANPGYVRANPNVEERFKSLRPLNRNYVAHEYFNRDWNPMHFSEVASWVAPAKLTYAGSAHFLDHVDVLNLTGDQQALLADIADADFRQSVRDFMTNQQFRRDLWVRGPRQLSLLAKAEALRAQPFLLISDRADVSLKVAGALGEATLNDGVYGPILDQLAGYDPKTIGEVAAGVETKGIALAQVVEAMMVLASGPDLALVQAEAVAERVRPQTDCLNAHLRDRARGNGEVTFLASPLTGGGIPVSRFGQLFLEAFGSGRQKPDEWAAYVWSVLSDQGQKIIKDGVTLETAEANLAELRGQATDFSKKALPGLKALGIA